MDFSPFFLFEDRTEVLDYFQDPAILSDIMAFSPYNPEDPVHRHRLHLPHWRQWDRCYFITTRLADSLPSHVRDDWVRHRNLWLAHHGQAPDADPHQFPEDQRNAFHRKFTAKFYELLDAGHGACLLARVELSVILCEVMAAGHGAAYHLDAWVIMPNHFHALVEPLGDTTLGQVLKTWKGATARKINQACNRSGSLWQAEAFDHIVRSEAQLEHFRRYIASNPAKAGLRDGCILGFGNQAGLSPSELLKK